MEDNKIASRESPLKGYKVTDKDGKCRGHLFEVSKDYKHNNPIKICNEGYHFCVKASHCFNYYTFDSNNRVFEVEAIGEYQTHEEDSKICTSHINIVRELSWAEVLVVVNEGVNNTGHSNSGNWNSGDGNSGAFCTVKLPFTLFNKKCEMTEEAFCNSKAYKLMNSVDVCIWVPQSVMTAEEKENNPKYETTEGYLKTIPFKKAFKNQWLNWNKENRQAFTKLENFSDSLFEEITGIKVMKDDK